MARWQRRARFGLGLFAVVFGAALWLMMGDRQPPPDRPAVARIDPEAVSEITGGDAVQLKGARRDIRVEFVTQVLYSDGSTRYTGFKAFVDDRGGRSFEITGEEARVAPGQAAIDVHGDVVVRTSDGLVARTPQASFAEADGILRGDGPLTFERARVSGSGTGFRYDRSLDRLELLRDAAIDVAPEDGEGGMRVRSGSAAHSRTERFMRFEGGVRMERGDQIIEAAAATVFLRRERDEPELIELREDARITGAADTATLRNMQARDINLRYAPDGRTLEHALLVGQGRIQLAPPDGTTGQTLSAEVIDVQLSADGAVTALTARDAVRADLPATSGTGTRSVRSASLTASGVPGRGLTQMTFEGDVVYREDGDARQPARLARARTLNASLTETGAIGEALFSGGFEFEEGNLTASSPEAAYDVAKGTLALRSPKDGATPVIEDERLELRATIIDAALSPLVLTASGKVSALLAPGRTAGGGTSLLNDAEPVLIVCEDFSYSEHTGEGTYRGGARLMQQKSGNEIRGDVITMNEKTGSLTARGSVVTSLPIAARADEGAAGNSLARAGEFTFDDEKRRAVFVKDATLDGSQGNLQADRIELELAPTSNDLRRLVAEGAVTALVDEREATGDHLVYQPADERYILNGTPVRIVQGCQESTGRTLTFQRGSDSILVDGNEETRVQTKGGKCPDSPR